MASRTPSTLKLNQSLTVTNAHLLLATTQRLPESMSSLFAGLVPTFQALLSKSSSHLLKLEKEPAVAMVRSWSLEPKQAMWQWRGQSSTAFSSPALLSRLQRTTCPPSSPRRTEARKERLSQRWVQLLSTLRSSELFAATQEWVSSCLL